MHKEKKKERHTKYENMQRTIDAQKHFAYGIGKMLHNPHSYRQLT